MNWLIGVSAVIACIIGYVFDNDNSGIYIVGAVAFAIITITWRKGYKCEDSGESE
jgi:hypothetical protein